MAQLERPLSPFMQYRWLYTNTLSILHRITGIVLSAGFLILVYWLTAAARGPDAFDRATRFLGSLPMRLLLLGVLWSYCYHLLNGIRHLVFDAGIGFERRTARASGWSIAIGSVLLTLIAWLLLTTGPGGGGTV
jgi:succinate dehydrogenase / fumarate reductase cytochrome b subunit